MGIFFGVAEVVAGGLAFWVVKPVRYRQGDAPNVFVPIMSFAVPVMSLPRLCSNLKIYNLTPSMSDYQQLGHSFPMSVDE